MPVGLSHACLPVNLAVERHGVVKQRIRILKRISILIGHIELEDNIAALFFGDAAPVLRDLQVCFHARGIGTAKHNQTIRADATALQCLVTADGYSASRASLNNCHICCGNCTLGTFGRGLDELVRKRLPRAFVLEDVRFGIG